MGEVGVEEEAEVVEGAATAPRPEVGLIVVITSGSVHVNCVDNSWNLGDRAPETPLEAEPGVKFKEEVGVSLGEGSDTVSSITVVAVPNLAELVGEIAIGKDKVSSTTTSCIFDATGGT